MGVVAVWPLLRQRFCSCSMGGMSSKEWNGRDKRNRDLLRDCPIRHVLHSSAQLRSLSTATQFVCHFSLCAVSRLWRPQY
jgi:hypothetical protein